MARGMQLIAEQHAVISERIVSSAAWVDSFFWDRQIEAEAQQTRLKLSFSLLGGDREGVQFDSKARFRLSLPMLNERLQLLVADDGDDETVFALDPSHARWAPRDRTEEGTMAGLRYFFTQTARRNSSLKASVRLRSGTPVLFLEPRYRQDFLLDDWLLRFTQRLTLFSDGDLQVRTLFSLNRPLPEWGSGFLFRTFTEGIWFEDRSGYFYHLDVRILQNLGRLRDLEYAWINEFQTRPSHRLEATRLRIAYRQNIHWDWLFIEVAPQLAFPHDRNYQPEASLLLKLDIYFGAYASPP